MILEVAILNVRAGEGVAFEQAFSQAQDIISSMPGYASHQLQRCLESQEKYLLLVQWQRLEDHTIGFRRSQQYQEWKHLLHHFYEPFPTVEHYELVATNGVIAVQSGKDRLLTGPPHTTRHAGPHRAVHQQGAHNFVMRSREPSSIDHGYSPVPALSTNRSSSQLALPATSTNASSFCC